MSSKEKLGTFKAAHEAKLAQIDTQKEPIQADIAALVELETAIEAEKVAYAEAEAQKKYAEGHAAGIEVGYEQGLADAKQAGGDDKLYSDAQMNEFLATATAKAKKDATEEALAIVEAGHAQENSIEVSVIDQLKAKASAQ